MCYKIYLVYISNQTNVLYELNPVLLTHHGWPRTTWQRWQPTRRVIMPTPSSHIKTGQGIRCEDMEDEGHVPFAASEFIIYKMHQQSPSQELPRLCSPSLLHCSHYSTRYILITSEELATGTDATAPNHFSSSMATSGTTSPSSSCSCPSNGSSQGRARASN